MLRSSPSKEERDGSLWFKIKNRFIEERATERFEDEHLDFLIVKTKAFVLVYEHLVSCVSKSQPQNCEDLRNSCLDLCDEICKGGI